MITITMFTRAKPGGLNSENKEMEKRKGSREGKSPRGPSQWLT